MDEQPTWAQCRHTAPSSARILRRKPNQAMQQALDPAAERGLRPQPASASNVPDGKC